MTLVLCWVAFPAVLAVLSLGCGLLLERAVGIPLSRALLLPAGFAVLVVAAQFATLSSTTARLTVPLVLTLAALGLASAYPWKRPRLDGWAAAAALGAFAVFAAPVVLSGEATFAGYIKLDDTATFLGLVDRALEHGRSVEGLAPSSYEATVALNLPYYPLGSLLPLGIGAALVGQDVAWVFQPYVAFLAALLGLVLYELAGLAVGSRPIRAGVAFLAAQPALLYGYSLWGGVKELAAAPLIALVAVLCRPAFRRESSDRELLPLAVAGAALLGVLSVGGAVWVVVPALAVLVALVRARRFRALAWSTGAFAFLLLPALTVGRYLLSSTTNEPLRNESELGNLVAPLSLLQVVGIWPAGDFRFSPPDMELTYVLIGVVVLAAVVGLFAVALARAWGIALFAATAVGSAVAFAVFGSPWVAAKAFAVGAPAVLLAAGVGAAALFTRGRRVEAAVLGVVLVGGVAWSNALAYREVNLAPRGQLAELEQIGERFAGRGPALMTEYQPYGVRHFLRRLDAEGASELRRRIVPLRDGTALSKGATADLDAFELEGLLTYRTIVLRRSPLASRPPAPYALAWRGRYYEVWERTAAAEKIMKHLPLGTTATPIAKPSCREIRRLRRLRGGGFLAAPARAAAVVLPLTAGTLPPNWLPTSDPNVVVPGGGGRLDAGIHLPATARYEVWIGGSFRGRLDVVIDGVRVARAWHRLSYGGQFFSLGHAPLTAGRHSARLIYQPGGLRPGTGGDAWAFGPLVFSQEVDAEPAEVPLSRAGVLCRRELDWVELRASY